MMTDEIALTPEAAKAIDELKTLLLHEKDLSNVMQKFCDSAAQHDFVHLGPEVRLPNLRSIVHKSLGTVMGDTKTPLQDVVLRRVREKAFCHGAYTFKGVYGIVFYYEDIEKGMVALRTTPELMLRVTAVGIDANVAVVKGPTEPV